jgi:hypothetical protein
MSDANVVPIRPSSGQPSEPPEWLALVERIDHTVTEARNVIRAHGDKSRAFRTARWELRCTLVRLQQPYGDYEVALDRMVGQGAPVGAVNELRASLRAFMKLLDDFIWALRDSNPEAR